MANKFQRFFDLLELAGECERAGKYRQAIEYVLQASKEPDLMSDHVWLWKYTYAIFNFLYGNEEESESAYVNLLDLRRQILTEYRSSFLYDEEYTGFSHVISWLLIPSYKRLLHFILWKKMNYSETVPLYEEIALEYYTITKKEMYQDEEFKADERLLALYFLGCFYYQNGKMLQAEKYLIEIWNMRTDFPIDQYSFCALVRLMKLYMIQNKLLEASEICTYLIACLEENAISTFYQGDVQMFVEQCVTLMETCGKKKEAMEFLQYCIDDKIIVHSDKNDNMFFVYFSYLYYAVKEKKKINFFQLRKISKVFDDYIKSNPIDTLTQTIQIDCYQGLYYLNKLKNNRSAKTYLDKAMDIFLSHKLEASNRLAVFPQVWRAVSEYNEIGDKARVIECASYLLDHLMEFYSAAECYVDNEMLESYLDLVENSGFKMAYSSLYTSLGVEQKMEYVMNYKSILSSVIRLRNNYAKQSSDTKELLEKINQKRDRLAQQTTSGPLINVEEDKILRNELRDLEYEFAEKYGEMKTLAYYKLQQLMEVLPEDTVIVDFFFVQYELWKTGVFVRNQLNDEINLEIFIYKKSQGSSLHYHRVKAVQALGMQINDFLELVKDPHSRYEKAAQNLYNLLFKSFEDLLKGVNQIFICPHLHLCNVPIELILSTGNPALKDIQVTYCQSLRNFFETTVKGTDAVDANGFCIIGAPEFRLDASSENSSSGNYKRFTDDFAPLPYSEYEAMKIADITHDKCYLRKEASKFLIKKGYRYMHIATHGIMTEKSDNPWYESALAFSGVIDWLDTGVEKEAYGNGLLTAEEISRMNLAGTELVVLSACHSANSRFSPFEQQAGLHVAFGAAGVKYIISSLWEVDDLAGAVLMAKFYEYLNSGNSIAVCLQMARKAIQELTVSELTSMLKNDKSILQNVNGNLLEEFESMPAGYKLYKSPAFWSGFVCYRYE